MRAIGGIILAAVGCVFSFCAGYYCAPRERAQPVASVVPQSVPKTLQRPDLSLATAPPATTANRGLSALEVLKEYKRKNIRTWMMLVDGNGEVDMHAAMLLGLSENERNLIKTAVMRARRSVDGLRLASAVSQTSADGDVMTIRVPSIGQRGTGDYQSLLSEVQSLLGPERFELFSETCGESFDRLFDHFGADDVEYEIDLKHTQVAEGRASYVCKKSSVELDPRGFGTHGGSTNIVSAADSQDIFLNRFLFRLPPPRE